MPKRMHKMICLILVAVFIALPPVGKANAFSLTDFLSPVYSSLETEKSGMGSGSSFTGVLFSLIFGKFFGGLLNSADDSNPTANISTHSSVTQNKEMIGFYAEWWGADTASFTSLSQNADAIQSIAPFWATLNSNGTLANRGGTDHKAVVDFAHKMGKSVLLLVNNEKSLSNGVLPIHSVLRSQELRTKSIDNLESYLKTYRLDGVNIDFEMIPAEDKVYLTAFMRELSSRLKPQGYIISIDVFPKQDESNDVAAAYDYAELAKYADKIIIMTYDNHGVWSGPGPIADIRWVEKSLQYALQFIPKNKLFIGIAAYGYDWGGTQPESIEHKQLQSLLTAHTPAVLWDELSQSPHFSYSDKLGQKHQVWFENSESIKYKLDLVNKYEIAGAAMWRLGGEDPAYWPVIRSKFQR